MMKKHSTYRLSEKAKATISFLKESQYGRDATHIIECALAQAEALWHMRDKINKDQQAMQHVEIGIHEQKAIQQIQGQVITTNPPKYVIGASLAGARSNAKNFFLKTK